MAAEEHSNKRREVSASASVGVNSRVGEENDGHCLRLGSSESLLPGLIDDVALSCLARVPRSDYPLLSCVNKRFNKLINGGDLVGLRKELGIVEYLVFMVFDRRGWLMFSLMKKKWMVLPKIPCDGWISQANKESLAVDDELLVFGRELFQFAIWKYSLRSRCWVKCKEVHNMHSPRTAGSGFFMDGKFYVLSSMALCSLCNFPIWSCSPQRDQPSI